MKKQIGLLSDGPEDGPIVLLAHGAGIPMNAPFMTHFAKGLADQGFRAVRFEFAFMRQMRETGQRVPPGAPQEMMREMAAIVNHLGGPENVIIGGKSLGGRVAMGLAAGMAKAGRPVKGLFCLGFPFHPPEQPENIQAAIFDNISQPVLLLQGSADPLGSRQEVEAHGMPEHVSLHWLEDGDHDFGTGDGSTRTKQQNWDEAAAALVEYCKSVETPSGS